MYSRISLNEQPVEADITMEHVTSRYARGIRTVIMTEYDVNLTTMHVRGTITKITP